MSQPPNDNDDLDAAMRRMEQEFGRRPPAEGSEAPPPAARPGLDPASGSGPPTGSGPPPGYQPSPPQPMIRIAVTSRPIASFTLLAAIAVIYVLSCLLSGNLFTPDFRVLLLLGAKENSLIANGELWRLVTATFLHGNLIHIFLNGYSLYALGPDSERIYGTPRFLALYFLAGIGGSVLSYLLSPAPSVGASGAIFGLMGGLGIFFYLNREAFGQAGRAQFQNIAAIGFINLLIGFSAPGIIDNFGHLGGLIAGLIAGFALAPRFRLDSSSSPARVVRSTTSWGWGLVAALGATLIALATLLPGNGV